jgi:drug/metabolite transporter (DMT)-like permease
LAALALLGFLALRGRTLPLSLRAWRGFLIMGLLNNAIPFALINWGQTQIDSGLAAILNATTPLFTVLLAHLCTADEKLTRKRVAGVLLGLAGVIVMIGPSALRGPLLGAQGLAGLGKLAVVCAALSYAGAGLFGRRLTGLSPVVAACGMLVASALVMLPVALIVDGPAGLAAARSAGPPIWSALAGLALLSTALADIVYFRILATAGATNLLLVTFLIPVSALMLGGLFLGERPGPGEFAGMALIFRRRRQAAGAAAPAGGSGQSAGSLSACSVSTRQVSSWSASTPAQIATHSSQIITRGPAIKCFTASPGLPQKAQTGSPAASPPVR